MSPLVIEEVEDVPAIDTNLKLTEIELKVRQILLDVADFIEQNPVGKEGFESQVKVSQDLQHEKLVLRFTGGWVRDKLLGVPSHDIDVAINKMTGEQFGLRLAEYMQIPGNAQKYDLDGVATDSKSDQKAGTSSKSKVIGGLHKIEANPERSKHLETVTTRILGLDIDLVNLRKETYSDDSRNPQIEFGTPEEDALRRDATANAMFYNIHAQEVEDFTGRGLTDLQNQILRTPLEPYQTFKDDPLRVLRLIRFASRLGWTIDPSALEAMQHEDIKEALHRKISRERVGIELEKALKGPDPHEALRLIFDLGLYETIFCDPSADTPQVKPETGDWELIIDTVRGLIDNDDVIAQLAIREPEEQFLTWQLSAIVPYRNAPAPEGQPGKKAPPPFATTVAREGIKATNKVSEIITASVRRSSEISSLVDQFTAQGAGRRKPGQEDLLARDVLGMKLRLWGSTWRSQVVYALLADIADSPAQANAYITRYSKLLTYLQDQNLLDVYEMRPLMDGKALAKALDTKPGPWMKDALDVVMAWQLRNPGQSDTAGAVEEVKKHGELATSLAKHFLELTIRPSFQKTKPSDLTDQARRDITKKLPPRVTADDELVTKPWKQAGEATILSLLEWSVNALTEKNIEQLWPLVVPPILTLIDDWETRYKSLGTKLLGVLLNATPRVLLQRTGLGPVFEQALLPCLTFFPPLTTEEDCLSLLPSVYKTLILLARKQHPNLEVAPAEPAWKAMPPQRVKALDTIMRKGVLYEYSHVGERPAIVVMLFDTLDHLIRELGIDAVKHLKYVLSMLNETLTHRLGKHHLASLRSAARSLMTVIEVCQPRIAGHRGDALKGLTICWLNVQDDTSDQAGQLRADLKQCTKRLRTAISDDTLWMPDTDMLVSADGELAGLLR